MTKTSQEIEQEFINRLKSFSGKDLDSWLTVLKKSSIEKRNDIIKWLKAEHNFGHMNASLLVGIFLNAGKPVYVSKQNLFVNQTKTMRL